jgi:hypothetical protein
VQLFDHLIGASHERRRDGEAANTNGGPPGGRSSSQANPAPHLTKAPEAVSGALLASRGDAGANDAVFASRKTGSRLLWRR